MAAPTYTGASSAANASASATIAAGTSRTAFTVDLTAAWYGNLQVGGTFGTIAATAGLKVAIYVMVGATPVADTVAMLPFVITAVSGAQDKTIQLQQGKYSVVLTNLDAVNAITLVFATLDVAV